MTHCCIDSHELQKLSRIVSKMMLSMTSYFTQLHFISSNLHLSANYEQNTDLSQGFDVMHPT